MTASRFDVLLTITRDMPDPRERRGLRHPIWEVLFVALVGVLAGADGADAIEIFGIENEEWFRRRCALQHGIPSQDTFLRVLAAMDPRAFESLFRRWVDELWGERGGDHIAIDGKTLRGSFDRASGSNAIHSVSAYLTEHGLCLGQVRVEHKENEIVAIPELLDLIDIKGMTITIDAMGCQRAIAAKIIDRRGKYVLQVKDNHPTLNAQIGTYFADARRESRPLNDPAPKLTTHHETDAGHGRIEERTMTVSHDLSWIDDAAAWKGLAGIAHIERSRSDERTGKTSVESAHFIFSDEHATAADLHRYVRDHWAIENSLHWVLDMTFHEDQSRVRMGHAAKNFATLRRMALNLLRTAPNPPRHKKKLSIRQKRTVCGLNGNYRASVLRLADSPPESPAG
jgi:predicted transposase YbfD/YdcC